MATRPSSDIDLRSDRFFADPYPSYDELLDRGIALIDGTWFVGRHADSVALFKDVRVSKQLPTSRGFVPLARSMVFLDPPDHTRVRGVVQQAFTPAAIRRLEERMAVIVGQMIDGLRRQRRIDFHARFALLYPVTVIAEMLEVPPDRLAVLHRRAAQYTAATDVSVFPGLAAMRQVRAIRSLHGYFRDLVAFRRRAPLGGILTNMIAALDAGRIDDAELVDACVLLLVAGSDTTTNLLGMGLLSLLRHPDQMDMLRDDPALIPGAIEEMMRYESPVQRSTYRMTLSPIEVAGVVIPAGSSVCPVIGAANRDPREFPDPHRFDVRRRPNRHIAFGVGIHTCIGAALARSEARIGFRKLLDAFPRMRLACDPTTLHWRRNVTMRGLRKLPVEL